jgi:hypothetical protein
VTPIGRMVGADEGMRVVYGDGREEALVVESWDHLGA